MERVTPQTETRSSSRHCSGSRTEQELVGLDAEVNTGIEEQGYRDTLEGLKLQIKDEYGLGLKLQRLDWNCS